MKSFWKIWGIVSLVIIIGLVTFGGLKLWDKSQDEIVAKIGDYNIAYSEWFDVLKSEHGTEILDQLINQAVVSQAAEELGVVVTDEQIEQELERMKTGYDSDAQFLDVIGESIDDLKQDIRFNLLLEEIAIHDLVISDTEVKAYYEENLDLFTENAAVHLHQIVVDTKDEAIQIISELQNGSNFAAIAQEQSTDVFSAGNGGDLGWVTYEDPSIELEVIEAATDLPINEISQPIQIFTGYAVIKVEGKKEQTIAPFQSVKNRIRRDIALQQVDSLPDVLSKLRKDKGVKINKMFQSFSH